MYKFIKSSILISSLLVGSALTCFAGTNLDFALKLAKAGYPELAQKYLEKEPAKSDPNKEGRFKVLGEIELQLAKASPDLKSRSEHTKLAAGYFKQTKQTPLEAADFSFSLANLIKMGLKEPGLSEAQKNSIASEAIPYFEEAKTQYKAYIEANKKPFEEFMDKVMDDPAGKFRNSKEFKAGLKNIYEPFVISQMRYFEGVVEKVNLLPKGDASRCTGLDKVISEADDFGYLVEAPVPVATVGVYVARIYGIMADCGSNAKESQENAITKFKEVLATEKPSHSGDAEIIREIKSKAIHGMIEMALRTSDYPSALEAIELYTSSREAIMPSNYRYNMDDFEIMLNGIIVNSNAFKKNKDSKDPKEVSANEKYNRNIDKIKLHLEKAIQISNSAGFWKKKLNAYLNESAEIMGKPITDPLIFIQMADEKRSETKYEEAIPLYEKALAGKIGPTDRLAKKPDAYFNLAFCAYKLEKNELGVKTMKDFFTEFPPADARYKSLKEDYSRSSKLFYAMTNKLYAVTKTDQDREIMMKSLDYLEMFNPEGVIFIKIGALTSSNNFIDAIKLADTVKKDSVDYDKATYIKGVTQFNYSKETKSKNNDVHNELSIKLAEDSKKTFIELLAFMKSDPTDIIIEKKEARKIWEKESKKLIAFLFLSLEDHKNAIDSLLALNEEYKKNPDDKKSSNRLYVLQGVLTTYSSLYNAEKDNNLKQEYILKWDKVLKEFKDLDASAFEVKDKSKKPEERKSDILSNFNLKIAMMKITNPLKDKQMVIEGVDLLKESGKGKKIENMDLYLARKFLDLKDYENAIICLIKVLKEYEDKGWSLPLKPEDFMPIKNKLISDIDRTLFKINFEIHAFPPKDTEGREIQKNTRDYSRLKKNLEYAIGEVAISKTEEPEEKKLREKIQDGMKKEPWIGIKSSSEIVKLQKKLVDFLTYLGIIDDLAMCNQRTNKFEDAIKYSEIMRANYPGILVEDIKLADLKFDYAKFLMKEKATEDKSLEVFKEVYKMFLEIKAKLEFNKTTKLYKEINEKRLICMAMIHKLNSDKEVLEQINRALTIMYANQEVYIEYTNLFAVLESLSLMPADLKPMTPEEIRLHNEANLEKDRLENEKLIKEKIELEVKELAKRKAGAVGADASFFPIEMRDLDSAKFDLFKSYYEKIQGAAPLKQGADEKDLLDAFNLVLRNPLMHKSLPAEFNRAEPVVAGFIKTLDEYVQMQGTEKAKGTTQTVSLNRKIIESCFPQLPKITD